MLNTVIHGDCLIEMQKIADKSIDMILTDPPYLLSNSSGNKGCLKSLKKVQSGLKDIENGIDVNNVFCEFQRILKKFNCFCFCSNKQISEIMQWGETNGYITNLLVWHKLNAPPFVHGTWKSDLEFIIHIREKGATFKGGCDVKSKLYQSNMVNDKYPHPTVKPIELLSRYIEVGTNSGDTVLDCFGGSGTTAIACMNTNRNYILIEKEQKYIDIINNRIENHRNLFTKAN